MISTTNASLIILDFPIEELHCPRAWIRSVLSSPEMRNSFFGLQRLIQPHNALSNDLSLRLVVLSED